jgi:hypothetical protein
MLRAGKSDKSVLPTRACREQLPASNNAAHDTSAARARPPRQPDGMAGLDVPGLSPAGRKRVADVAAARGPAEPGLSLQPSRPSRGNSCAKRLGFRCFCTGMAPSVCELGSLLSRNETLRLNPERIPQSSPGLNPVFILHSTFCLLHSPSPPPEGGCFDLSCKCQTNANNHPKIKRLLCIRGTVSSQC